MELIIVRGFNKRVVALPVVGIGAAALVALAGGVADAAVSTGTVTLTVSDSFIAQLAESGVALVPTDATVTYNSSADTVSIAYTATGGDATLTNGTGTIQLSGGLLGFSIAGKVVYLSSLEFDLYNGQFDGAVSGGTVTPLLDLAGNSTGTISGADQTFASNELNVDPEGAALLDGALDTGVFNTLANDGADAGSFSAAWTTG
jgi:hypothetical protein